MEAGTLLYVDDSPEDRFLFSKAGSHARVAFQLQNVESGAAAQDYLQGVGQYADRTRFPVPDLLLLDLKMPMPDGFTVLRWIREREEFNPLRVCVFTSSFQHEDIQMAYALNANAFLTKPADFNRLQAIATALNASLTGQGNSALEALPEFRRA